MYRSWWPHDLARFTEFKFPQISMDNLFIKHFIKLIFWVTFHNQFPSWQDSWICDRNFHEKVIRHKQQIQPNNQIHNTKFQKIKPYRKHMKR